MNEISELFTESELLDPDLVVAWKAFTGKMKFGPDDAESIMLYRLKITGQSEMIKTAKRQIEILKKELRKEFHKL